jgi:hypothetical protein
MKDDEALRKGAPGRTVEQLRAAIDSGRAGSKTNALDPAAVPLGADEEAGGAPVDSREIETAFNAEIDSDQPGKPLAHNDAMPLARGRTGGAAVGLVLAAVVLAIVGAAGFLLQLG